ncbi:MAG: hemerythrin domain-containing protein, partial [Gammaproteobacteria bacterium]
MPKHPIDKLRQEHANMRRVLMLLRMQLDLLEQRSTPDYVLMVNALYYMRKFPSVVHHPKEDLIFQKLLEAGAPLWQEVERLRQQHQDIYALEDWLIELALEVQAGKRAHAAKLLELGRHYLDSQAKHVETEERILFPQALKRLKLRDWKAVRDRSELSTATSVSEIRGKL